MPATKLGTWKQLSNRECLLWRSLKRTELSSKLENLGLEVQPYREYHQCIDKEAVITQNKIKGLY
jgi:uroporphyrinogen-III synthase